MTKSKGIGRGGRRKGAGRPRFAKTGKTEFFSTRITPKTRDLLEAEAHRRRESVSSVAEDLLQLGLEEMAAIRNPQPLKALLFLVEMLRIPDYYGDHLDDSYSWQSNPYMFVAFRAAVTSLLDVLRPRGEIITPPPGPLISDDELGELQVTFPDSPDEYGRLCAHDLLSRARSHGQAISSRSHGQAEEPGSIGALFKWLLDTRPRFARIHFGLADAWDGLNKAVQRRKQK
jgi:hypothetical protein